MAITKIVITGGPCAGKSSAAKRIRDIFTQRGYTVLFIPETATELMSCGVTPRSCGSLNAYQRYQMELQLEKERIFEAAARTMDADKILIVCDRGFVDCKAYMDDSAFYDSLSALHADEIALQDRYQAVFHLVTAAKGAGEFYTLDNNSARTETPEEAAALDDRVLAAWTGHPYFRVIDSAADFEEKMSRLIGEIAAFLTANEHGDS